MYLLARYLLINGYASGCYFILSQNFHSSSFCPRKGLDLPTIHGYNFRPHCLLSSCHFLLIRAYWQLVELAVRGLRRSQTEPGFLLKCTVAQSLCRLTIGMNCYVNGKGSGHITPSCKLFVVKSIKQWGRGRRYPLILLIAVITSQVPTNLSNVIFASRLSRGVHTKLSD